VRRDTSERERIGRARGQPLLEDVASGMSFLCGGKNPMFHR
jgi:hypothetical protein